MKKILVILAFVLIPVVSSAATIQEQYNSALRQLLVLYGQLVNEVIVELNALPSRLTEAPLALLTIPVYTDITLPAPEPVISTPSAPQPVPPASAPVVMEPTLLTPHIEVTSVKTEIEKGQWARNVMELNVSNIDDILLLSLAPITATTDIPNWEPEIVVNYKFGDIVSGFKLPKGGTIDPITVTIKNVPDQVGHVTLTIQPWTFAGQYTGNLITSPDFPLSQTFEIK